MGLVWGAGFAVLSPVAESMQKLVSGWSRSIERYRTLSIYKLQDITQLHHSKLHYNHQNSTVHCKEGGHLHIEVPIMSFASTNNH